MLKMPQPNLQFVILQHVMKDGEHWDLMLETKDALATWQLREHPTQLGAGVSSIATKRIGDHRKAYLEYEGPVSGGRGTVTRVDSGTWRLIESDEHAWRIELDGRILRGHYVIEGIATGSSGRLKPRGE